MTALSTRTFSRSFLAAGALLALAGGAFAEDLKLPDTLVWTAYNTGTSGYNQAIAIGSVLKNRNGVNLRVLPGKNDVSRLSPLRSGKAQFSATGSDSIYAQEAVYTFGTRKWGPQPIRILMLNVGDGASVSFATRKSDNFKSVADLKGKRVAWVRGAPALNQAVLSMLQFGGLSWDDVEKVEVGGYGASVDALIRGDLDAFEGATHSTSMLKVDAAPGGLAHIPIPHDDAAGWKRLNAVVPWYFPHVATLGVAVPDGGIQLVNTAYPILVSMAKMEDDLAYNMTKAMYAYYDEYKDGAPGANGWALEKQKFGGVYLPFHPGAIRYYTEIGVWKPEYQAVHEGNLKRQDVIQAAWKTHVEQASDDDEAFNKGWMAARYGALNDAGLNPIFKEW